MRPDTAHGNESNFHGEGDSFFSGVRPSSGAATSEAEEAWKWLVTHSSAELAAPEDGRIPCFCSGRETRNTVKPAARSKLSTGTAKSIRPRGTWATRKQHAGMVIAPRM